MDERHVIVLSYLETNGKGKIIQVSGLLISCVSQIVRCWFGKRYVLVRLKLLGWEKEVFLGVILKEDICREFYDVLKGKRQNDSIGHAIETHRILFEELGK